MFVPRDPKSPGGSRVGSREWHGRWGGGFKLKILRELFTRVQSVCGDGFKGGVPWFFHSVIKLLLVLWNLPLPLTYILHCITFGWHHPLFCAFLCSKYSRIKEWPFLPSVVLDPKVLLLLMLAISLPHPSPCGSICSAAVLACYCISGLSRSTRSCQEHGQSVIIHKPATSLASQVDMLPVLYSKISQQRSSLEKQEKLVCP